MIAINVSVDQTTNEGIPQSVGLLLNLNLNPLPQLFQNASVKFHQEMLVICIQSSNTTGFVPHSGVPGFVGIRERDVVDPCSLRLFPTNNEAPL